MHPDVVGGRCGKGLGSVELAAALSDQAPFGVRSRQILLINFQSGATAEAMFQEMEMHREIERILETGSKATVQTYFCIVIETRGLIATIEIQQKILNKVINREASAE